MGVGRDHVEIAGRQPEESSQLNVLADPIVCLRQCCASQRVGSYQLCKEMCDPTLRDCRNARISRAFGEQRL